MHTFTTIYCDFDGTISKQDSVNSFFSKYALPEWQQIEMSWQQNKITSKECLIKQLELVRGVDEHVLDSYLNSIELDEYFLEFYSYLLKTGRKLVILSDGFEFFIRKILQNHGIYNYECYSNTLEFDGEKFRVSFKNHNPRCEYGAGTCKCLKVNENKFVYIGDGLSDICIGQKASILYAKNSLRKYCDSIGINYRKFATFYDVLADLRKGDINATANSTN